jgi:hypothetical protein
VQLRESHGAAVAAHELAQCAGWLLGVAFDVAEFEAKLQAAAARYAETCQRQGLLLRPLLSC